MALLLIRHGETEFNAGRVVQFPDTPLAPTGLNQAAQLGQKLAERQIGLVLTSDYKRALTTAEHVARCVGADLLESPHLRERNFGDIRGKSYEELHPVDIFHRDFVPPSGESWDVFDARVDLAWAEVVKQSEKVTGDLAVVTHGLVLRSLLERTLDVSGHEIGTELVVANTSVTIVDHQPPWRVTDLANTEHLVEGANDVAPV